MSPHLINAEIRGWCGQLVRFRSPAWQTASLREDTRIVATTLSCAASETLRRHFQPDILVCDESEQCLEEDHMIGISLERLKAVILIGDSNEPALKAISKDNESMNMSNILSVPFCVDSATLVTRSRSCERTTDAIPLSWNSTTRYSMKARLDWGRITTTWSVFAVLGAPLTEAGATSRNRV